MIAVNFPDEDSLRAATEAIATVVNTEGGIGDALHDQPTPAYRAERALDAALLAHEQDKPPTAVWTVTTLLHVAAHNAGEALDKVQDALVADGPVTVTTSDGHSMAFIYMNLPEDAQYAYDLSEVSRNT